MRSLLSQESRSEDIDDIVTQIELFIVSECLQIPVMKDKGLAQEAKEASIAANKLGKHVFELAKTHQERGKRVHLTRSCPKFFRTYSLFFYSYRSRKSKPPKRAPNAGST